VEDILTNGELLIPKAFVCEHLKHFSSARARQDQPETSVRIPWVLNKAHDHLELVVLAGLRVNRSMRVARRRSSDAVQCAAVSHQDR